MRYFVTIDGEEHEVELVERSGELEIRYDGEPVDVVCEEVDRHGQLAVQVLGEEGGAAQSHAVSIEGDAGTLRVTIAGRVHAVSLEDERERAAHAADRAGGPGGGEVKAVMPGVVVEVLVAEGDRVEAGQPLLVLEAMKMQNEIAAPAAGRVDALHVAAGRSVASGERLVTLAAD